MDKFILLHIFHHSEKPVFEQIVSKLSYLSIEKLPEFYKDSADSLGIFAKRNVDVNEVSLFRTLAKEFAYKSRKKLIEFAAQYSPETVDIGETTIYVNHVKAFNEIKAFVNSNRLNFQVFLGKLWENNPFEIKQKSKK